MTETDGYVIQEFSGGRQPVGIAASAHDVVFADAGDRSVGRLDRSGALTLLRLPDGDGRPHGIASGDQDELWIAEWSNGSGNRVSRVSADGTSYDFVDLDGYGTPRNLVITDREVFFTVGSKLGRLRLSEQAIELHSFPGETAWRQVESTPLVADAHGGIWIGFGGAVVGFIARFDAEHETWETVEIAEFLPTGLSFTPEGDLWFTEFGHSRIGRLTSGGNIERWDHAGNPFGIAASPSGEIWVSEFASNRLTQLDASSGMPIQSVDLPSADSQPQNLVFDAEAALWYTGQRGIVGRYGTPADMPNAGIVTEVALHDLPRLKDLAPVGLDLNADLPADSVPIRIAVSEHPSFIPPPADVVIWRYVDLPKLVSMLSTRALFFARLDTQADPFEGSLPNRDGPDVDFDQISPSGLSADQLRDFVTVHRESLRIFRPRALISCWHVNDYESMAMWDLYARSGSGIAIRSTSGRLVRSLHHDGGATAPLPSAYLGMVSYIDYARTIVVPNTALAFLALKRTSFAHERELRVILLSNNRVRGGQNVACDLEALVDAVYVAPAAAGWFREAVQEVVERFGLSQQVRQSDLDVDPVL